MSGNQNEAKSFEQKADLLRKRSKALLDYIYAQGQVSDVKIQ